MKNKIILAALGVLAILLGVFAWQNARKQEAETMEGYRQALGGTVYEAVDGHDAGHGKYYGFYNYRLELREDGSWTLNFDYWNSKEGRRTAELTNSGSEWVVERDEDAYVLVARGGTPWQDWQAAKISMRMEIDEYEGEIRLRTTRDGYSTVLFRPEE